MMMWLSNEDEVLQDCKEDQREVMVVWRFPLCFSRKIGSNDESFYIPAVFLCGMQIMDTCLMTCQIIGIIVRMGQDLMVRIYCGIATDSSSSSSSTFNLCCGDHGYNLNL